MWVWELTMSVCVEPNHYECVGEGTEYESGGG